MTMAPPATNLGANSLEAAGPSGEEGDVHTRDIGGGRVLHHHRIAPERKPTAGRTGGGEQPQVIDGEFPIFENRPHHRPDLAGSSEDCHTHGASLGVRLGTEP